ncbi:hypothetical protein RRG08_013080 [Elysia crispata]|uniref:Uncharacterized protein n=1 Tax=Elysia crispata TaxID=231223 RepID=A0AAE1A1Z9_9GAST|nr:hypothetical protein RRG08_013080 [Elysia crispata]
MKPHHMKAVRRPAGQATGAISVLPPCAGAGQTLQPNDSVVCGLMSPSPTSNYIDLICAAPRVQAGLLYHSRHENVRHS